MKHEVKVSFYLKRDEEKVDRKCPVVARLTVGKSEVKFSAKMSVPTSIWGSGRANGKSLAAVEINRQLDKMRASATTHYRELSAVKENVTARQVKHLLLGMACGQETLLTFFRAHNENFDKRVGVNRKSKSARAYWTALAHLTGFLQAKYRLSDIPFTALNKSFIEKFDLYLRIECGHAPGTIVMYTTRLGTIIKKAIAEGIITANPFAGYIPEFPQRRQKYLTRDELDRMMTTPLNTSKHYLIRDLFLFSCYTGLSYVDMQNLTDETIEIAGDGVVWIKSHREKTGMDFQIPLMELPLKIIDRYRGAAANGRLLPIPHNTELNLQLKEIARTCGITRRLTFHFGRHTYASEITLSQGVPIETVSRMLGHSRIKTTQIYAKITDEKIDEDMKELEKRLAGQFQFAI